MEKPLPNLTVFTLVFVLLTSNTLLIGYSSAAGNAGWLALLIAACLAAVFYALMLKLVRLYPRMNWFEVQTKVLGRFGGKAATVVYIVLSLRNGAMLCAYLSRFVGVTSRNSRLSGVFLLVFVAVAVTVAAVSVERTADFVRLLFPVMAVIVAVSFVFYAFKFDASNLEPVFEYGASGVLRAACELLSVPFGQTLYLFVFLSAADGGKGLNRTVYTALCVSAAVLAGEFAVNIAVLGGAAAETLNYASYMALSVLDVTEFLQRIEIILSVNYLLGGLVKTALCFQFSLRGLSHLTNGKSGALLALPMGALMLGISQAMFSSSDEMFLFLEYYPWVAAPLLIVWPAVITVIAIVRERRRKRRIARNGISNPVTGDA